MAGAAFPLFAIIFAGAFEAFSMPYNCVLPNVHKWAALFPVLGLMAAVGAFLKVHISMLLWKRQKAIPSSKFNMIYNI